VLLAFVLVLLLVASLAAKIVRYGTHLGNGREDAEARIAKVLTAQGFVTMNSVDLVTGGVVRAMRFQAPTCTEPTMIVVLSGSAEGDDLLNQFLPPGRYDTGFVYGGVETDRPPLVRFLTVETVRAIGRAVGLPAVGIQPLLGIANPTGCATKPVWPALW
jgi:hypothetical protein